LIYKYGKWLTKANFDEKGESQSFLEGLSEFEKKSN
jgi:hypothetical protein